MKMSKVLRVALLALCALGANSLMATRSLSAQPECSNTGCSGPTECDFLSGTKCKKGTENPNDPNSPPFCEVRYC